MPKHLFFADSFREIRDKLHLFRNYSPNGFFLQSTIVQDEDEDWWTVHVELGSKSEIPFFLMKIGMICLKLLSYKLALK